MNVLLTNPQEIQAYTIMRSLRPFARKVVITVGGDSVNHDGFAGMLAYSRFVDARHDVPHFAADWLAGQIQPDNTAGEEAYIRRLEHICRLEQIDVIFPSLDPEVYVLAKNKERLQRQGIVAVVPEADVVRVPLDKALTMQAAERVGFPCPRTFFPQSGADLASIVAESRPPWIVKPRFTAHGIGMARADDPAALGEAYASLSQSSRAPIVQEYVGGSRRQNYYVTVDREGRILTLLSPRSVRTHDWGGYRVSTKTAISATEAPCLDAMRDLLRELRLWGGYTIQTKVDPRDGVPKLMEINARIGQHVWWRTGLGVNEPLILVQLARGEPPCGNFAFREGVMLLDPFHDFCNLYRLFLAGLYRWLSGLPQSLIGRTDRAPAEPGLRAALRNCWLDYVNLRPKVLAPEVSAILADPYPCLRSFAFKLGSPTADFFRNFSGAFTRRLRRMAGAA